MSPISEEDVLACLVLWAATPVVTNEYSTEQQMEALAWRQAAMTDRPGPGGLVAARRVAEFFDGDLERAIADSERRWEVEKCERRILDLVDYYWGVATMPDPLLEAQSNLVLARSEVTRHAR